MERIGFDRDEERAQVARELAECGTYKSCSACPWCSGPPEAQECTRHMVERALAVGLLGTGNSRRNT